MNKRGKKLLGSLSIIIVILAVASMFFVMAQTNDESKLSIQEKGAIKKQLDDVAQEGLSSTVQEYVEEFVEQKGINPSDINNVSEVDFAALPEEVEIENVNDANLAIYEVGYNESSTETKQVFVVTYSVEKLETTADLIAHPDKRQLLQFGLIDETSSSFLNTATGVPGSLKSGYIMMRQGSITGISTNIDVINPNGGIIDIVIYKNGEAISFGNTLESAKNIQKDYDVQSKGVVTFEPGDTISVQAVSSNSGTTFKNVITMVEITTVD